MESNSYYKFFYGEIRSLGRYDWQDGNQKYNPDNELEDNYDPSKAAYLTFKEGIVYLHLHNEREILTQSFPVIDSRENEDTTTIEIINRYEYSGITKQATQINIQKGDTKLHIDFTHFFDRYPGAFTGIYIIAEQIDTDPFEIKPPEPKPKPKYIESPSARPSAD